MCDESLSLEVCSFVRKSVQCGDEGRPFGVSRKLVCELCKNKWLLLLEPLITSVKRLRGFVVANLYIP